MRTPVNVAGYVCLLLASIFVFQIDGKYHDSQTFLDAAKLLDGRNNPYIDPYFLNSFTLIYPFSAFAGLFSPSVGPVIWQVINTIGIAVFALFISGRKSNPLLIWSLVMILITSPARAMYASVQHTGLILGFLAGALAISKYNENENRLGLHFATAALLVFAFELKPQLALPVIMYLFWDKKSRSSTIWWAGITGFLHVALTLYFGMPLDKLWITRLTTRSEVTTEVNSGDNSFWIIPSSILGNSQFWLYLGFLLYASLLILIGVPRIRLRYENSMRIFIFLVPLSLPYLHTYDYLVLAVLAANAFFAIDTKISTYIAVMLLIMPTVAIPERFQVSALQGGILFFGFLAIKYINKREILAGWEWLPVVITFGIYFVCYRQIDSVNLRVTTLLSCILLAALWGHRNFVRQ